MYLAYLIILCFLEIKVKTVVIFFAETDIVYNNVVLFRNYIRFRLYVLYFIIYFSREKFK